MAKTNAPAGGKPNTGQAHADAAGKAAGGESTAHKVDRDPVNDAILGRGSQTAPDGSTAPADVSDGPSPAPELTPHPRGSYDNTTAAPGTTGHAPSAQDTTIDQREAVADAADDRIAAEKASPIVDERTGIEASTTNAGRAALGAAGVSPTHQPANIVPIGSPNAQLRPDLPRLGDGSARGETQPGIPPPGAYQRRDHHPDATPRVRRRGRH
jgi:hypothetical protein